MKHKFLFCTVFLSVLLLAGCTNTPVYLYDDCLSDSECSEVVIDDVTKDSSSLSKSFSEIELLDDSIMSFRYKRVNDDAGRLYITYIINQEISSDIIEEVKQVLSDVYEIIDSQTIDFGYEFNVVFTNGNVEMQLFDDWVAVVIFFELVVDDFSEFIIDNKDVIKEIASLTGFQVDFVLLKGDSKVRINFEYSSNRIILYYSNIENEDGLNQIFNQEFSEYDIID